MRNEFSNEIENEEKNMNNKIFNAYFGYYTPSSLVEDLYKVNQYKNEKFLNQINDSLIEIENLGNRKSCH